MRERTGRELANGAYWTSGPSETRAPSVEVSTALRTAPRAEGCAPGWPHDWEAGYSEAASHAILAALAA